MLHTDVNLGIFVADVTGSSFCGIDATMLAACATESHLQVGESAFKETLYVMVH